MDIKELTVRAGDLSLAVKTWGHPASPVILALHGWMDNAASFDRLAPRLGDYYWVVPDLPGHGQSDHRGEGADYTIWAYCVEVMALVEAMGLKNFILVGHSMGGGIASLLAAIYPERVEKLVLLDAIGVMTTPPAEALEQMRRSLQQKVFYDRRQAGIYKTREDAVDARAKKGLDSGSASLLGERGIDSDERGYYWRQDQRLSEASLLRMTDEQTAPFLEAIACPVLLVTSSEAVQKEEAIRQRTGMVKDIRVVQLPGGHHQHMDGDIETLAVEIGDFLQGRE